MTVDSLEIVLLGTLGAEIRGVDLAEPLDDHTVAAIRRALVDHQADKPF